MEKCKKQEDDFLKIIQEQKKKTDGLSTETQKQYDTVNNLKSEMDEWHINSKNCISEIQKQQTKANELSSQIKAQKDIANSGVSEIENQQKSATELTNKIKEQHDTDLSIIQKKQKEYDQLNKKIEGLLPGATSAGLAGSYHDAQKAENTKMYWVGFIVSLVVLMIIYGWVLISKEPDWANIASRTVTGLPLVWMAWYFQRSISQTNRIKEEYHHKQRIMAVFDGFSKEIDRLTENDSKTNKEKKLELISAIINAISKNPAETINPSETFLDSVKNPKSKNRVNKNNNVEEPEK